MCFRTFRLAEALDKVRGYIKNRRIAMFEFFRSFDALGLKKITKTQFARALTTTGVKLTSQEIEALVRPSHVDMAYIIMANLLYRL